MVHFKLTYFNFRGRAEIIRMIFVAANQPFQDERIEPANWPAFKSQTPFGQMPVLEITTDNGNVIQLAQTMAIARHLARQFRLAGSNELEETFADMYAEQVHDLFSEYAKIAREKDVEKKQELQEKMQRETLPANLAKIEARLADNRGHLAGCGITYADVIH